MLRRWLQRLLKMKKLKLLNQNTGLFSNRVNYKYPDERVNLEKVFQEEWNKENHPKSFTNPIAQTLFTASLKEAKEFNCPDMDIDKIWGLDSLSSEQRVFVYKLTAREQKIIATIIQWLGTNVGFSFLTKCLEKGGYIVEESKKHKAKQEKAWKKRAEINRKEYEQRVKEEERKKQEKERIEQEMINALEKQRKRNKGYFINKGSLLPKEKSKDIPDTITFIPQGRFI